MAVTNYYFSVKDLILALRLREKPVEFDFSFTFVASN